MSREYAMSRIKDALEQSGGNHMKAHHLIMSWLEKDNSLYFGITAPHLKSLVTHAIAHVDQPEKEEPKKSLNLDAQEKSDLSDAILSSLSSGSKTGSFGEGNPEGVPKPTKASQAHIDTLNAIAQASKGKK